MDVQIESSWKKELDHEFRSTYFIELTNFVRQEFQTQKIFPPARLIFSAFDHCDFDSTKVVIIGQDPYHGPGQANGLCFSVAEGVKAPPSLVNIFKELHADLNVPVPNNGSLTRWADQGVLLLNATLTVRAATPGSHQGKGWEQFTDAVIDRLNKGKNNLVFMLWGAYAQKKGSFIDRNKHLVIESPHPSPFSVHRGFFGSKPFSRANEYLLNTGQQQIEW